LLTPEAQELLITLNRELTFTFGGATIMRGLDGSYLSDRGQFIRDRVNLIYTVTRFAFQENLALISEYADTLRQAVQSVLHEEDILIIAYPVYRAS
jgi:hypothetical protein